MDTDAILKEVGHFGKYQVFIFFLLLLGGTYTTFYSISFVFTAGDLDYRCFIEECDSKNTTVVDKNIWLHYAVPYRNNKPEKCERFLAINSTDTEEFDVDTCRVDAFSKNKTERCKRFLYNTDETSIVNDFNLQCQDNNWKRAAVGTANYIGQFLGLPLCGILSDKYGRKTIFTISTLFSVLMGISRSFSTSYEMFVSLEFLDGFLAAGTYGAIFILGIELLAPNRRVIGSVIISSYYTVGEIVLGIAAWYLRDWRLLLRAIYAPGIIFIFYFWLIPESIGWLISNKKFSEAKRMVERIAVMNNIEISQELNKQLETLGDGKNIKSLNERRPSLIERHRSVYKELITSKIMIIRTAICAFSWMTNAMLFYGLTLGSVNVGSNRYVSFILTSLVELPGYAMTYIVMDRLGRKVSLFSSLALAGISCLSTVFIPPEMQDLNLIVRIFGKGATSLSFTVLYIYSSEFFPTKARQSLMGTCSMFGRVGVIVAPLMPLAAVYINPMLIFGGIALLAASLGLYFPETLHQKLPETIRDAELLGRESKSNESPT